MNNLSARLTINRWFASRGLWPIPASVSYLDFATETRRRVANSLHQVTFVERSDAVRYLRLIAKQIMGGHL